MATVKQVAGPPVIPPEIEKQLLTVEMIPIDQLIVDRNYQREKDQDRVTNMKLHWNWMACGTLTVSLRNGKNDKSEYALIDGQQRHYTIKELGYTEAPCRVYVDLTEKQEAELFELLNTAKKPNYNDLFKSRLNRGEEKARYINTAVETVGYHLDPERRRTSSLSHLSGHYYLQTMRELERIFNQGGSLLIIDTLKLYKECFGGEHVGKQAMVISGIARFLRTYKTFNRTDLITKMKRAGVDKIVQLAYQWVSVHGRSGGENVSRAFCEAMLSVYNQNRQEENRIKSKNL